MRLSDTGRFQKDRKTRRNEAAIDYDSVSSSRLTRLRPSNIEPAAMITALIDSKPSMANSELPAVDDVKVVVAKTGAELDETEVTWDRRVVCSVVTTESG